MCGIQWVTFGFGGIDAAKTSQLWIDNFYEFFPLGWFIWFCLPEEGGSSEAIAVRCAITVTDDFGQALGYTARGIPGIKRLQALDLPEAVEQIKAFTAKNT